MCVYVVYVRYRIDNDMPKNVVKIVNVCACAWVGVKREREREREREKRTGD